RLAAAIAAVARAHRDLTFVYPVHLNPAVREAVTPELSGEPNVRLLDPLDYLAMVALLDRSVLVITDSGGIQEEGPALDRPAAARRNVTGRREGVGGVLRLPGIDPAEVEAGLLALLGDEAELARMRAAPNPHGDGRASERIAQAVAWRFGLAERPADWRAEARAGRPPARRRASGARGAPLGTRPSTSSASPGRCRAAPPRCGGAAPR